MSIEIKMPTLSPSMTKGVLSNWLVEVGEQVNPGDIIAEVETDKVMVELEAEQGGTVIELMAAQGEEVPVDAVIMTIGEKGELKRQPSQPAPSPQPTPAESAPPSPSVAIVDESEAVSLSPLAKRMVAQAQLDVSELCGTGAKGRIMKRDIEQYLGASVKQQASLNNKLETTQPVASAVEINEQLLPPFSRVKNSAMRNVVAARLTESSRDIPHFHLSVDCQVDDLLVIREQLNERANGQYKISVNDFVLKAVARAMKQVPEANCMWAGDSVLNFHQVDIAMAVALQDGLITPVLRNVAAMGLADIANNSKALARGAREGKLSPQQYQGGTFTVSNLGMFGIREFTSIINPPQNGILSVGVAEQRPVVKDGELSVATVMSLTLAMDHRCVDGAIGAKFIQAVKGIIEDPLCLML